MGRGCGGQPASRTAWQRGLCPCHPACPSRAGWTPNSTAGHLAQHPRPPSLCPRSYHSSDVSCTVTRAWAEKPHFLNQKLGEPKIAIGTLGQSGTSGYHTQGPVREKRSSQLVHSNAGMQRAELLGFAFSGTATQGRHPVSPESLKWPAGVSRWRLSSRGEDGHTESPGGLPTVDNPKRPRIQLLWGKTKSGDKCSIDFFKPMGRASLGGSAV